MAGVGKRGVACTICTHPDREQMEKLVISGHTMKKVSEDFSVSYYAMHSHVKHHLKPAIRKVMEQTPVVEQVRSLVARAEKALNRLEADDADSEVAAKQLGSMYRELRSSLELLGKMTGEFQTASVRRLLEKCGAKDEDELEAWCEERRHLGEMALEDYFRDGCNILRFCLEQRPELAEQAYRDAFPKALPASEAVEIVEEVEDGTVPAAGN